MTKSILFWLLGTFLLTTAPAEAQQPTKAPRIGFLSTTSRATNADRIEAFQQGLRDLGYVEGKNIVIEFRFAEGKLDRLRELAAELVRLRVDVIVTAGGQSTPRAKQATSTVPIVISNEPDPVGSGFVASLSHPGGNITGLTTMAPELNGKRLEILKEISPKLSRVVVFGTSTTAGTTQILRDTEAAGRAFGVHVQYFDVQDPKDITGAFQTATKRNPDAVLVLQSAVFNFQRKQIAELAAKSRLPAIYEAAAFVEAGGLMSYGVIGTELFRRAAIYVDRILKGARPAELPVEQPTKFELVINLKAAKQIGVTIPPHVLAQGDRVIR
jgi:putative tryptophan/tyrosine transport system substrate-binding protein